MKANETDIPPRLKHVIFRMAEITGVPIEQVLAFKEMLGEPIMSDPEFNQGLVALAEFTLPENESELECGKKSVVHAGIVVRETMASALQDDVNDPKALILEKKQLFMQLFELYGRNLISVAKHVLDMYQVEQEMKKDLVSFLEKDVFETE